MGPWIKWFPEYDKPLGRPVSVERVRFVSIQRTTSAKIREPIDPRRSRLAKPSTTFGADQLLSKSMCEAISNSWHVYAIFSFHSQRIEYLLIPFFQQAACHALVFQVEDQSLPASALTFLQHC